MFPQYDYALNASVFAALTGTTGKEGKSAQKESIDVALVVALTYQLYTFKARSRELRHV